MVFNHPGKFKDWDYLELISSRDPLWLEWLMLHFEYWIYLKENLKNDILIILQFSAMGLQWSGSGDFGSLHPHGWWGLPAQPHCFRSQFRFWTQLKPLCPASVYVQQCDEPFPAFDPPHLRTQELPQLLSWDTTHSSLPGSSKYHALIRYRHAPWSDYSG